MKKKTVKNDKVILVLRKLNTLKSVLACRSAMPTGSNWWWPIIKIYQVLSMDYFH